MQLNMTDCQDCNNHTPRPSNDDDVQVDQSTIHREDESSPRGLRRIVNYFRHLSNHRSQPAISSESDTLSNDSPGGGESCYQHESELDRRDDCDESSSSLEHHSDDPHTNNLAYNSLDVESSQQESESVNDKTTGRDTYNVTEQQEPNSKKPQRLHRKIFDSVKRRRSSKNDQNVDTRVILLDGEEIAFWLNDNAFGQELLNLVIDHLDLFEKDYFGLTYVNNRYGTWFWLELDKKIKKQLKSTDQRLFHFQVRFYPPDPNALHEELTRYLLTLQLRQDIFTGKLPCPYEMQALLGSLQAQSELGDYQDDMEGEKVLFDYRNKLEIVSNPTPELLQEIARLHKTHKGMKTSDADRKYIEVAKQLELYGYDLHSVKDNKGLDCKIGFGFHGVVAYRGEKRIDGYNWTKLRWIKYRSNSFYLKILPELGQTYQSASFQLLNSHYAHRLWSTAIEHHIFFRCKKVEESDDVNFFDKTYHQLQTLQIPSSRHFNRSVPDDDSIKSVRFHSLNRPHPRDMTVGRSQMSDEVISERSMPTQFSTIQSHHRRALSSSTGRQIRNSMYLGSTFSLNHTRNEDDNIAIAVPVLSNKQVEHNSSHRLPPTIPAKPKDLRPQCDNATPPRTLSLGNQKHRLQNNCKVDSMQTPTNVEQSLPINGRENDSSSLDPKAESQKTSCNGMPHLMHNSSHRLPPTIPAKPKDFRPQCENTTPPRTLSLGNQKHRLENNCKVDSMQTPTNAEQSLPINGRENDSSSLDPKAESQKASCNGMPHWHNSSHRLPPTIPVKPKDLRPQCENTTPPRTLSLGNQKHRLQNNCKVDSMQTPTNAEQSLPINGRENDSSSLDPKAESQKASCNGMPHW